MAEEETEDVTEREAMVGAGAAGSAGAAAGNLGDALRFEPGEV